MAEQSWKHSTGQKIEKIYMWVATEPDGGEGIPSMMLDGIWFPMLGADTDRIESMRSQAVAIRAATGRPVALVEFTGRRVVETLA